MSISGGWSSWTSRTPRSSIRCASACSPIRSSRITKSSCWTPPPVTEVRFGVLQFPGSCDEVDALHAARRVGDAELLWHGEKDLKGVDAVIVPGGFSYGDYLRAGAIARFAPVMEAVIAFAQEGGLV